MREHRQVSLPVFRVDQGDQVEIAGWPALVKYSEPYSDHVWYLEVEGHFADGEPFTTAIKIPADQQVRVRRKPTRKEQDR